jgi:membrane fusion protein (multidrug efflux system)
MRLVLSSSLCALSVLLAGCGAATTAARAPGTKEGLSASADVLEVVGQTQPAPGRIATIAPVVLHPVTEVTVAPGDRVKKDQVLVKLDDDEARAEVRAKRAALAELQAGLKRLKAQPREEERAEARAILESARLSLEQNRELLGMMEQTSGILPYGTIQATKFSVLPSQTEERAATARLERLLKQPVELEIAEAEARVAAAQAALESARAELEHYTVTASIDGVVTWLEVNTGTASRPGTSVWGEIVDLSAIDVGCDLTPAQAARVAVGQAAEVRQEGQRGPWAGRVVFVGMAADRRTGRVPVRVRLKETQERVRCYVEVTVRFGPRSWCDLRQGAGAPGPGLPDAGGSLPRHQGHEGRNSGIMPRSRRYGEAEAAQPRRWWRP